MTKNTSTSQVFDAGDEAVLAELIQGAITNGGWVNFAPGRLEDLEEFLPREGPFSSFFGRPVRPFAEVSVVPGKVVSIGVSHGAGRLGAAGLKERELELDTGWKVTQDHVRRGLVVEAPSDAVAIARFVATALRTLTATPPQGQWTALRFSAKP